MLYAYDVQMSHESLNTTKSNKDSHYLLFIIATCSVVLLLQNYLSASGIAGNFISGLPYFIKLNTSFAYVLGWGIFTIFIYTFIPLMTIYALKETPKQYGVPCHSQLLASSPHIVCVCVWLSLYIYIHLNIFMYIYI